MDRAPIGIVVLLGLAFLCSEDRRRIPWRTVISGLLLQFALALLLLRVPAATRAVFSVNDAATALQNATQAGTRFVFGYLGGPPLPFAESHPGGSFILALQALPLVLTISALASLLFYWGVLQRITAAFAWLLRRVMGIGGALALGAAVHVFVGMVEAPLLVRPYLARMQRGELFALMTCGMAGVAGTVMVIYGSFLSPIVPNALGQYPDRVCDQHAGRPGDRRVDGAVRRTGAGRGQAGDTRSAGLVTGCAGEGHARRHSDSCQHHRGADRGRGGGRAGQHGAWPVAAMGRRRRSHCSVCSPCRSGR